MKMSTDVSTDGKFSRPQQNPYVGYNYYVVPRMPQAIPLIPHNL